MSFYGGDSDDIWFPSVLFSDSRADRLLCETHPHLFFFYPGKSRYFLFHKDSQQVGCSFFRKQFLSLFRAQIGSSSGGYRGGYVMKGQPGVPANDYLHY